MLVGNGNRVEEFTDTGAFVKTLVSPGSGGLYNAIDLSIAPGSGDLYVDSSDGADQIGKILRYDSTTGAFKGVVANAPTNYTFKAFAFGPDGDMYTLACQDNADSFLDRRDPTTGAVLQEHEITSSWTLSGLNFGPDGNIYLYGGQVHPDHPGTVITRWSAQTLTPVPPPYGIFVPQDPRLANNDTGHVYYGPDGNLYAPAADSSVVRYNGTTGAFIDVFAAAPGIAVAAAPTELGWAPDGSLYVTYFQGGPSGNVLHYDGMTGASLGAVPIPPDGWFQPRSLLFVANPLAVTNTNDSGPGSLRAAITYANTHPGLDTITFNIPGAGVHTIAPTSPLPTVTDPVIIDGYSEPGSSPNTFASGDNAVLTIELSGQNLSSGTGLALATSGSTVRGLAINRFPADGMVQLIGGDHNVIVGNFFGLHPDGTAAGPNAWRGISMFNSTDNTIGGTNPADRNILSNGFDGLFIGGTSTRNTVEGNYIGTDPTGTQAVGNSIFGIRLENNVGGNTIGGSAPGSGNLISGNDLAGIALGNSPGNTIQGNYIGTDVTGNVALGNSGFSGINVGDSANNLILDNVISGNNTQGIAIGGAHATGNVIQGNRIGTNAAGTAALGNNGFGVAIYGSDSNTIGGTVAGTGNIIAGNAQDQVALGGATNTLVQGNFIGTNASGTAALGPVNRRVSLYGNATGNIIGGTTPGARNIISGGFDGVYVTGAGTTGNVVEGNYIGTDVTGTVALANTVYGIRLEFAPGNTIGGTTTGAGNLISGNDLAGVAIIGNTAAGNLVQGNYIGTNAAGTAALGNAGFAGVSIQDAPQNTIGGTTAGAGNVISGNSTEGIGIGGGNASGNLVQGNLIGTDRTGTAPLGNQGVGVAVVNGSSNTIGGTSSGAGNVIAANSADGVYIAGGGATGNLVEGNYIGTDVTGTAALGNHNNGLEVDAANNNTIGGTDAGAGNVISANAANGVFIGNNSTGNVLAGNLIGTDKTGTVALGNQGTGGVFLTSGGNTIGGTIAAARNIISGNTNWGVIFAGPSGNLLEGDTIGTSSSGLVALSNGLDGVYILSPNNIIGGTAAGAGNLISANGWKGIRIASPAASGNVVQGNLIGTDRTGTAALGNHEDGIFLDSAPGNTIGGSTTGAGNVLSANTWKGIRIAGSTAIGNVVQGNLIGVGSDGATSLGNHEDGVWIVNAVNTTIGGTGPGEGNVIAHSGWNGVFISGSGAIGNSVRGNSMYANNAAGIVLDSGANNHQTFPTLIAAGAVGTSTGVVGTLSSLANNSFSVDFYASAAAHPSGFGEGQRYLGTATVSTDASGNATFSMLLPALGPGETVVTATATDPNGNTSQFSAAVGLVPLADLDLNGAGTLRYTASAGIDNNLTLSLAGGSYTLTDTSEKIFVTGAGAAACLGTGTNTVTCFQPAVTSLAIYLGDGNDVFHLQSRLGVPATLDGGSGTNTLDYSGYAGDVMVNLALGTATGFSGGIGNIQNVTGGMGNSLLMGDAGVNVLRGGTGRSLLIGGGGADQLFGGGDDSLLIGGTTLWDTNSTAMAALFREWTRTDKNFHQRVSDLMNGTGLNGSYTLNADPTVGPVTVFGDGAVNQLTGGTGGLDWFFIRQHVDQVFNVKPGDKVTRI
jgi:parallel beta-helix repeat protein